MTKHTPGPWFAVGAWVEVEDDNVAYICTCHPDDIQQGHLGRSDAEIMANARLIAAAPELLAAAQTIMENLDGMVGEVTSGYHEDIIAPLRDAIAYATGGKS